MQKPSSSDIRGIDISRWQGDIDFSRVKGAGVGLIYVKSTQGATLIDPDFEANAENAQSAGIAHGFYHYFTGSDAASARAQAEFFAGAIGGHAAQARPAVELGYDKNLSARQFSDVCLVFLREAEALLGVKPMIYSSAYGAREYLLAPLDEYPLWVANYGVAAPEPNPRWSEWAGFQYSDTGRVAGIGARVDLDWFTAAALIDETRLPAAHATSSSKYRSGVIYYAVQLGDTLSAIAQRYGVSAEAIASWNSILDPDIIYPGQVLAIYSTRDAIKRGGDILHVVALGETLNAIARRYGVSVQALIDANDIANPNAIYAGEVLYIPSPGYVPRPTTAPYPLKAAYIVHRGDTLIRIAQRFGVSWRALCAANGLADPSRIYVGQILSLCATPLDGAQSAFTGYYQAQSGDTLQALAVKFNTSAAELSVANNLSVLAAPQPGRILRIQPDGWGKV